MGEFAISAELTLTVFLIERTHDGFVVAVGFGVEKLLLLRYAFDVVVW